MRIVSGKARGRALEGFRKETPGLRPTADRVRESLFNILGQAFNGERVLDLYAGTGAVALEALSRGAGTALLVDHDVEAVKLCTKNAQTLGLADQVTVWKSTAAQAAERLAKEGRMFDFVFADPPYALHAGKEILAWVEARKLLAPEGTLVIEHDKRETLPDAVGDLKWTDTRGFGDTRLSFFRLT